jgi:hypothetical protein
VFTSLLSLSHLDSITHIDMAAAAYTLSRHLAGKDLLNSFDFFNGEDPSKGFVK